MSDDLERRLRRSLNERALDSLNEHAALPAATRRRARTRRVMNVAGATVAAVAVIAGSTMLVSRRTVTSKPPALPAVSPTRVPEPSLGTPSVAPAPNSTPAASAIHRVAEVPDAGAKIVAHNSVWVVATTRVLRYSLGGGLQARIVIPGLLGPKAVLEPRVVAADEAGVWVAGSGVNGVGRTRASRSCVPVEPLGGDRPGSVFVVRIDAATACPSVFIKLGTARQQRRASPGLLPPPSPPPEQTRPRIVRWHGLAKAAGSLWIGADEGMLRVNLDDGVIEELGLNAYSVGAGFGSVWAAVSQERGSPQEENFIARIDPETGVVEAEIDVEAADPSATTDFAEVHVGRDAVWAEGWGVVAQISPATNQVIARYQIGGEHLQGDMAGGDGVFFLADNGSAANGVWMIDATRRRLQKKIATGGAISGIALAGDRLWFSRQGIIYRMKID